MDYNSLVAQIQSYAFRTDATFSTQIPNFINQAMNRIAQQVRDIGFLKTVQGNFVANDTLFAKPADWKETISFRFTIPGAEPFSSFVMPRSREYCQAYWVNPTAVAVPEFYADEDYDNFYIAPTPDQAYETQLIYFAIPIFNALNPRNFLTDKYPRLLLYACLVEATIWLKMPENLQFYDGIFSQELGVINSLARERYGDRSTNRGKI